MKTLMVFCLVVAACAGLSFCSSDDTAPVVVDSGTQDLAVVVLDGPKVVVDQTAITPDAGVPVVVDTGVVAQ